MSRINSKTKLLVACLRNGLLHHADLDVLNLSDGLAGIYRRVHGAFVQRTMTNMRHEKPGIEYSEDDFAADAEVMDACRDFVSCGAIQLMAVEELERWQRAPNAEHIHVKDRILPLCCSVKSLSQGKMTILQQVRPGGERTLLFTIDQQHTPGALADFELAPVAEVVVGILVDKQLVADHLGFRRQRDQTRRFLDEYMLLHQIADVVLIDDSIAVRTTKVILVVFGQVERDAAPRTRDRLLGGGNSHGMMAFGAALYPLKDQLVAPRTFNNILALQIFSLVTLGTNWRDPATLAGKEIALPCCCGIPAAGASEVQQVFFLEHMDIPL